MALTDKPVVLTSNSNPFEADLSRLDHVRVRLKDARKYGLAVRLDDAVFLVEFIDKLWKEYTRVLTAPETFEWLSMVTAPKGGGAESVADPKWVEPPHILLLFEGGEVSVAYWDWHYAEGGGGYRPGLDAWVEPCSGEQLRLHYNAPIGWRHLPRPNTPKAKVHHPRCEWMQPHGHEPPKCTCPSESEGE